MPCTKILFAFRIVTFVLHIRVSEPDKAHFVSFFGRHSKLFAALDVPFWLVVTAKNLASGQRFSKQYTALIVALPTVPTHSHQVNLPTVPVVLGLTRWHRVQELL